MPLKRKFIKSGFYIRATYGKTLQDSSSLISSSSISCGSFVHEPTELVEEHISMHLSSEECTSAISAAASVLEGVSVDKLSSNDDDKLLQGCTIISLPAVIPGWIFGVGVLVFSLSQAG